MGSILKDSMSLDIDKNYSRSSNVTSIHEHFRAIPQPTALGERVKPQKWLNIPMCLVKAFQADIENQEYI